MLRLPQFDLRILTRNAMAFVLHALCLRISALTGFGVAAWVAADSDDQRSHRKGLDVFQAQAWRGDTVRVKHPHCLIHRLAADGQHENRVLQSKVGRQNVR